VKAANRIVAKATEMAADDFAEDLKWADNELAASRSDES
jgi:hypothetical protein